jgi:hypothetical protein
MADIDDERTVIVDREVRDTREVEDRSSPLGWIILLLVLLVAAWYFLFGSGSGWLGGSGTDTTSELENSNEVPTVTPGTNGSTDEFDAENNSEGSVDAMNDEGLPESTEE